MAPLFPKGSNTIARVSIAAFTLLVVFGAFVFDLIYKGLYVTNQNVPREQRVPFSHKHHVSGLGIDCRYCHTTVETSSFAGYPPLKTCMSCHSQIWTGASMLNPIRQSFRTGRPFMWVRVNQLPGYVYFDHSIHIAKGIGCTSCHGPVGDMPLTWAGADLHMKWCLDCHRHPEAQVRPRDQVFNVNYRRPANQGELGRRLVAEYHIQRKIECYTCHR